ncbi:hypothetical protein LCGC14_0651970 [marine sediment metagenome]|uniref:Uncharacterized protein n=1 Tax=marine sediment metagenome TaxID=412755 RepID=A0A0F9R175_9ZZZZ
MEQKKSIQLSQAFGAVLTLVLVAVLVIVAIVIFVSLASSFAGTEAVSVTNETVIIPGSGTVAVADATTCSFGDFGGTVLFNVSEGFGTVSNNILVLTTDYTIDSATGEITNVTGVWNETLTSYTYTFGSAACDASEDLTTEFGTYTSLIGLVGTIIFLGLVIGVLVAAFAFGGRRET